MALKQRPVSKTTYRLKPYVALGLAAFLMGTGTFFYFNFGNSFSSLAATISSFPYEESFESGIGDWVQSTSDDIDWTVRSGGTPSYYTGPSGASDGSYYIYTEASSQFNKVTIIESPEFDFSAGTNATMTFQYHMRGNTMGTMNLQASTDGTTWTSVWSKSGHQGNNWYFATVDLSAYDGESSLTLRFHGTTGSSYKSDMCVDDVSVSLDIPIDTDNDGILDVSDIDDDNDGLLDTDECPPQDTIRIGYFPNSRKHPTDNDHGYTFDGSHMINHSLPKLTNAANFGPSGTVPHTLIPVPITNNPVTASNLSSLNLDCIFIGDFTRNGIINGNSSISTTELSTIKTWSMQASSNLVIVTQREQELAWGYTLTSGNRNPVSPTAAGLNTLIFSGPFGSVSGFNQGGSFQGKVSGGDGVVLATETNGGSVIVLDNSTGDLILSDVDILTNLGGVSNGASINPGNGNDIVFANIWAYAISLITGSDADGDGLVNSVDLDSDNDGIWDANEAGHSASLGTDGRISNSNTGSGANGLFDGVETSAESGTINYSIANSETVPDGDYDFLEIDSDNDGCFDVRESGPVDQDFDGIAGNGAAVVDANGMVSSVTYVDALNYDWQDPSTISCISEICGNGIDDDKNGVIDDNSPGGTASSGINPVLWFDASDQNTITTSGTKVTNWTDKSGNIGDLTIRSGSPQYTGQINHNNVVNFTYDEMIAADAFGGSTDEAQIFFVSRENAASNNVLVSFNGRNGGNPVIPNSTSRFFFHAPWNSHRRWYWDPGNARMTSGERIRSDKNIANVGDISITSAFKSKALGINGFNINGHSYEYQGGVSRTAYTGYGLHLGWGTKDHDIAEIIAFDSKLDSTNLKKVQSYLGIKYGVTLGQDYISSDGQMLWDLSVNTGFNTCIAGIGVDACAGLNQLKSRSTDSDSKLIIQADTSEVQNGEFLVWGSNGKELGAYGIHDFPPESQGRIEREWRFTKTGNVGTVTLQFDLSNMGVVSATELQLLIDTDNDGVFHDESSMVGGVRNGATDLGSDIYEFDNISINGDLKISIGTSNKITNPLPIDLLMFEAELVDDQVDLTWATAAEIDNDFFTIEKTADMEYWVTVDQIDGAGNSNSVIDYATVDYEPLDGVSYYRLKQTDFNGDFTYSEVRTIRRNQENESTFLVYPNPARDFTSLELENGDISNFELMLINAAGQVLMSTQIPPNSRSYRLNLSGIKTGTYIITIWKGDMKLQKKIIVEQY